MAVTTTRRRIVMGLAVLLFGALTGGCVEPAGTGGGLQNLSGIAPASDGRYPTPEVDLPLKDINLQQLVNEAPDGSVVAIPLGRYVLSKSLTIARRKKLHLAFAPGTQLRVTDTDTAVILIEDCHDLKISGVRARHVEPLPEYECHGAVLSIHDSTNVVIDNCELNGCGAIGVSARKSTLSVMNCHIHHNSFNALYFSECEALVVGNIIEHNASTFQAYKCGEIIWSDNLIQNNGGYWRETRKPGLRLESEPDLRPTTND